MYVCQKLHVNLHLVLYKEYQSLKSRRHVEERSKSDIVPDSGNSVFGAYLNKKKSLTEKKFSFSSSSTKMLNWSKQSGWTNFQKFSNTEKLSKNECKELNEVRMCYHIVKILMMTLILIAEFSLSCQIKFAITLHASFQCHFI